MPAQNLKHKLLYPHHLNAAYFGKRRVRAWLEERLEQVAGNPIGHAASDAITVLIRTYNDEPNIQALLDEIKAQDFKGSVEIVLVDTNSTDQTRTIAKHHGAKIIPITQADFTYPKSLNLGFQAASNDAVLCVVGHTNLTSNQTLAAAYQQIAAGAAGAYGKQLLSQKSSRTERLIFGHKLHPEGPLTTAGFGALSANSCVISKKVWQALGGFDEAYAHGGEDTDLARRMIAAGYVVAFDPALSTHHSHGVGPINMARQFKHWNQVINGPGTFDTKAVARRRPDLAKRHKQH
jgi:GT2 family glycosyltransferase